MSVIEFDECTWFELNRQQTDIRCKEYSNDVSWNALEKLMLIYLQLVQKPLDIHFIIHSIFKKSKSGNSTLYVL